MEAVEQLNNQLTRRLKLKRSCSIGVIAPDTPNEFFPEILKGIDNTVHKNGYTIFFCNQRPDRPRCYAGLPRPWIAYPRRYRAHRI